MVALMWTKCEKALPVFSNNRVKSNKANAPSSIRRNAPGDKNPTDTGSRGLPIKELLQSELWFNKPPFLCDPKEQWLSDIGECRVDDEEGKRCLTSSETPKTRESLFDETRFSYGQSFSTSW
ncbi:unnamed protein product [Heligmosomoides polygyrus]|uniref:Ovule protein n=1 Tax=Heligmosomoides polygyrus TaxID=6339 RepID=A0A183F5D2_HELPZ|nr:unnamed protein product [Heligmosomoides polygyrus]